MKGIKSILLAEQTYVVLIAGLLVSIPFPYAFSSIAIIVLVSASFFSVFFHKMEFKKGYGIPMILYALMVLSLLWSVDVQKSLRGLERQLPFLILPLAFWMMPPLSKQAFVRILWIFSAAWALLALAFMGYSGFLYLQGRTLGVFYYHYLVSPLDLNAIYASVMVSLGLLFMIFYGQRKLLHITIGLILFLFLLLLSSKNIIIITVIAFFLGTFLSGKYRAKQRLILTLLGVAFVGVFFYGPIKQRWNAEFDSNIREALTSDSFGILYPWTGTSLRVFQARVFYELLEENPIFFTGFGINASQDKVTEKQNTYDLYCGYNEYNFHNQYIQTFAELGFFGFLLLVLMLLYLLRDFTKHREPMSLFLFLALTFVFLTETYIWRQRGMIHFLVLYGLLIKIQPLFRKQMEKV